MFKNLVELVNNQIQKLLKILDKIHYEKKLFPRKDLPEDTTNFMLNRIHNLEETVKDRIMNCANHNNDYVSAKGGIIKSVPVASSDTSRMKYIPHKLSTYVLALRPWSFSASLTPVALGAALAYKSSGSFNIIVFLVTCLTALSVHAAGNAVNTYYDYQKGIDSKRSDDRTLVDKILTPDEIVHLGALLYILGCVGFIMLVLLSPAKMEHLALVYFGGLSSSFLYTGGIGLKYIGLGDLLILVTFGPINVLFSFVSQAGYIDLVTLFYAVPLALNTEAVLHCNNTRDMESDSRAGAVTMAVLIGYTGSHILFAVLLFVPYILFTILSLHVSIWFLLPLITFPKALDLEKQFRSGLLSTLPKQTAKLNIYLGLFYLIACIMAAPNILPGLRVR